MTRRRVQEIMTRRRVQEKGYLAYYHAKSEVTYRDTAYQKIITFFLDFKYLRVCMMYQK